MGFEEDAVAAAVAAGLDRAAAIDLLTRGAEAEEPGPDQTGLAALTAMGFETSMAREALAAAGGNVERAVELLMG